MGVTQYCNYPSETKMGHVVNREVIDIYHMTAKEVDDLFHSYDRQANRRQLLEKNVG